MVDTESVAALVPDHSAFLSCDLFTEAPDSIDWFGSCCIDEGDNCWSSACFDFPQAQQLLEPACVVPAASIKPDASLAGSDADETTTLSPRLAITHRLLNDACDSAPQLKAVSDLLEPEEGCIVTCSCSALPKLRLDPGSILREWAAAGGAVAVDSGVAAQESITLCLPAVTLPAGLPEYDVARLPPAIAPVVSLGRPASAPLPAPVSARPQLLPEYSLSLRTSSLESTGGCGLTEAMLAELPGLIDGSEFSGPEEVCKDDALLAASLLAGITSPFAGFGTYGGGSGPLSCGGDDLLELAALPESLACIPSKTTGATAKRAACLARCKEKKRSRQSGKIRYAMRKINAEKRPRVKGRFVKRSELAQALERQLEAISPRSCTSSMSDTTWM